MLKPLTVWITTICGKLLVLGISDHPKKPVFIIRSNRTGRGTLDWFKIVKRIHQGCMLSPAYITYMQSTSWEMPCWMNHMMESRLLGEISKTENMQMISL